MVLNEAIRQGQAKIAEGLKTGQMRSDGPSTRKPGEHKADLDRPESVWQSPAKSGAALLRSKEKSINGGRWPLKVKLVALLCLTSVVVVILGMWLYSLLGPSQLDPGGNPEPSRLPAGGVYDPSKRVRSPQQVDDSRPGGSDLDPAVSVDKESAKAETSPPVSSVGLNVICIQSISRGRKGELIPLGEFFNGKGIWTEIIEISELNKVALVSRQGFERNPSSKGTEGYKLFVKIKQLGTVYVKETGDTKFGLKPFQDIYGYKRK